MNETRRKYGEGYIRETAAGTIEYRFRCTDEYGRRKYKSVSGVNEEHCYDVNVNIKSVPSFCRPDTEEYWLFFHRVCIRA